MLKILRILKQVLKRTQADKILFAFIIFFLCAALIVCLVEPGIVNYRESLWYCYEVFSTVGFGEVVAVTTIGRTVSVLITVLSILVVALVTGVIVAFYNDVMSMRYKASKAEILDKLERLPELSKEELQDLSERIKQIK